MAKCISDNGRAVKNSDGDTGSTDNYRGITVQFSLNYSSYVRF